MNVFQTTLLSKIAEKKNQLIAISSQKKSLRAISSTTEGESVELEKELHSEHPSLDYSTNKVLRQIKEFEEERLKKKQKAFKETPPV